MSFTAPRLALTALLLTIGAPLAAQAQVYGGTSTLTVSIAAAPSTLYQVNVPTGVWVMQGNVALQSITDSNVNVQCSFADSANSAIKQTTTNISTGVGPGNSSGGTAGTDGVITVTAPTTTIYFNCQTNVPGAVVQAPPGAALTVYPAGTLHLN